MKKLQLSTLFVLLALGFFTACQKDNAKISSLDTTYQALEEEAYSLENTDYDLNVSDRSSCITIAAGSIDALANAIDDSDENGVILLKSGMHTETQRITITKSVKIIGECGAVLKVASNLFPTANIDVAIHVLNAKRTLIKDVDIQPIAADGGCAILFENSRNSAVLRCKFTNFQISILVEKSRDVVITKNNIHVSGAWQLGIVGEGHGIVVMNGRNARVSENDVENAVFGIWACDKYGTCERNNLQANLVGLILCKVPTQYLLPNSTTAVGSEFSATSWKVKYNKCIGNFDNGIMIIDGSNNNRIYKNEVTGNGISPIAGVATDIEIFAQSEIFGFTTPTTFNNWIDATAYPGSTIKNCSTGNTIIGGILSTAACR